MNNEVREWEGKAMRRLLAGLTIVVVLSGFWYPRDGWAEAIGMVTGSKTGTYIRFGQDIAEAAKQVGLEIEVKESEGSIDNIRRLISTENAAFAIVQSDVLGYLSRSGEPQMRRIASQLRLIFPFYNEELHLLARQEIQRFEDLVGKRVVVGATKSGTWLTATNLLGLLNIKPAERLELKPEDGVSAVLTGKADAMFYVVGKPAKLFVTLGEMQNEPQFADMVKKLHFVPLQDKRTLQEYVPSSLGPSDYAWVGQTVDTIAVKSMLISFDFSANKTPYHRQRCAQLAQLSTAVRQNFAELQRTGHPKWKEVNLDQEIGTWKRDNCSKAALKPASADPSLEEQIRQRLTGK
jgi:TRAP transporter TAXI family solute receptor